MSDKNSNGWKKPDRIREQSETYDVFERVETIGGLRYELQPSPKLDHQVLVTALWNALDSACHTSGIVVVAPMDVHFDANNIVQPDIIFIANENMHIIRNKQIYGVPDLLVEILSPGSGKHDKFRKRNLYEEFQVREYWIVDPVLKTVDRFVLTEDKLQLVMTYNEEERITSELLPCVSVELGPLFARLKRFEAEGD